MKFKKIFFSVFLIFCFNIFSNVNYNVFVIMDNSAKENVESISKGLKEVGIDSLYSKGYAIHMTRRIVCRGPTGGLACLRLRAGQCQPAATGHRAANGGLAQQPATVAALEWAEPPPGGPLPSCLPGH